MELSFKVFNLKTNEWVHEQPVHLIGETILMGGFLKGVSIEDYDSLAVHQSTGWKDSNGVMIYFDCDIVSIEYQGQTLLGHFQLNEHTFRPYFVLERGSSDVSVYTASTIASYPRLIVGSKYSDFPEEGLYHIQWDDHTTTSIIKVEEDTCIIHSVGEASIDYYQSRSHIISMERVDEK